MIRVLIVDDESLARIRLQRLLEKIEGVEIVGQAANGADAVTLAGECLPDIVLMDMQMPVMDGAAATRRLKAQQPDIKVIILTTFDLDEYAFEGLRVGASGFLLKDAPPAELVRAIRTVASGDAVVSPRITRRMLDLFADRMPESNATPELRPAVDPRVESLTPREKEVLQAVAEGLSNLEIAERFVLSETTVKTHVGRVLAKLGVRDRVQAVVFAYETGLVRPS